MTGWILLSIGLGVAISLGVFWHKFLRLRIFPKNFGVTLPGRVYRSARLTGSAIRSLHKVTGIRTIVDLAGGGDPATRKAELEAIETLGIERHALTGMGGSGDGDPQSFVQALHIIADPAKHPVLFHCAAGANRTSTADVYFRHLAMGEPLEQAIKPAAGHDCDLSKRDRHMAYIRDNLPLIREAAEKDGWLNRFQNDRKTEDSKRPTCITWIKAILTRK